MRSYGLRATLFSVALCAALLAAASLWLGLVGAAAVSALLVALGWIIYFHSERKVLTALRAHPVSEVERPDLYRIVRELAFSAHLPVPRLFVSPAAQPNILTVGYSPRSAAVCCTEGLLRLLSLGELRAVLAHELAHVGRRDFAVSSWSAGLASLVASCPLIVVMLHITAPSGREYGADIDGALLTGDPLALVSALRKIDTAALAQPLRPRGTPPATNGDEQLNERAARNRPIAPLNSLAIFPSEKAPRPRRSSTAGQARWRRGARIPRAEQSTTISAASFHLLQRPLSCPDGLLTHKGRVLRFHPLPAVPARVSTADTLRDDPLEARRGESP